MKQLILLLVFLPLELLCQTTVVDSVSVKELGDITVYADAQRTSATKTVYNPNRNQKQAASDGISLLSNMNIPQLSVNPISLTVKTADNQVVSFFINYKAASKEDVNGLDPESVKRIEYLDFPVDARFQRSQHVVNFITYSFISGGYTKLSARERLLVHSGEAAVYSKFTCRRMEYDLMISGDYDNNSNIGSVSKEIYRMPSEILIRERGTETGRSRQRSLFTAFRASLEKNENFYLRNLLSYRHIDTPESTASGYVKFSSMYPEETFNSETPSFGTSFVFNSEVYAALGKGWSINGNLQSEFIHNDMSDNYTAGTTTIENQAKENSWSINGTMQVNKSLSERFTLFSSVSSGGGGYEIVYSGSSNAITRFSHTFTGVYLGFSLNCQKISGSIDGGYAFESNSINKKMMNDRYPFTHINIQYAPDQKNSLNFWLQYATFSPDATMKNPNVIRQSELMYVSGNPDLKCSRNISSGLSYVWLPNDRWQMSAFAAVFKISNRQIAVYNPDLYESIMLKKYMNDGDYNHGQLGIRLTGKFIKSQLICSLAPRLLLYKTTGSNSISYYPFTASLNVDYYVRKLFFNVYWDSGSGYVDGETAYKRKMPMNYSIGAGWSWNGLNLQLSVINLFQSSWKLSEDVIDTKWYGNRQTVLGAEYHRRVTIKLTYTFNYGRKPITGNEIQESENITSSILH